MLVISLIKLFNEQHRIFEVHSSKFLQFFTYKLYQRIKPLHAPVPVIYTWLPYIIKSLCFFLNSKLFHQYLLGSWYLLWCECMWGWTWFVAGLESWMSAASMWHMCIVHRLLGCKLRHLHTYRMFLGGFVLRCSLPASVFSSDISVMQLGMAWTYRQVQSCEDPLGFRRARYAFPVIIWQNI